MKPMKKTNNLWLSILAFFFIGVSSFSFKKNEIPKGWIQRGNDIASYVMEIDTIIKYGGKGSGCIHCVKEEITGFGTLMQMFQAKDYKGKMVKMSVYIRSEDVASGGLFFRVDGAEYMLSFANTQDEPIQGTNDWKLYNLTLPVPDDAVNIAFGSMLNGKGKLWADNYQFEIVPDNAHSDDITTDAMRGPKSPPSTRVFPEKPANLDFEE